LLTCCDNIVRDRCTVSSVVGLGLAMGQSVTVANASGSKLYVKIQSSVEVSEKADVTVSGSVPSTTGGSATGKVNVEVSIAYVFGVQEFSRRVDSHEYSNTLQRLFE